MPKPVKKHRKVRRDINQGAADLVAMTTQDREPPDFKAQLSAYMAELGAKGGKISGAKRMEMPVEERRRIASLAARAMWAKRKAEKKR